MKLMYPENRILKLCLALGAIVLLFLPVSLSAQSKKAVPAKKTVAKKTEKPAKDARKDKGKDVKGKTASAKDKKQDAKKADARKQAAKKDEKSKKDDPKDLKNLKKKNAKETAASKRAAEERRRQEEARRQAILAEQRRREQIAREARARALAFERNLRTETVENISKDDTTGEDLQIRSAAVNALGNRAGTVVVMEAQTGKVLTIVNQDWAVRNSYRPCSTVKLITAVAGVSENVIKDDGEIRNQPNFKMPLERALAFSNNVYFQRVGQSLGPQRMYSYGRFLGLGDKTGLNMAGEVPGRLPDTNTNARIYSHGDDTEVTPVQLAVMVSALTNGGKVVVPQIVHTQFEKASFQPRLRQQIPLDRDKYEEILPGMVGAAEYGTAHRGVDSTLGIAGKTGSCIGKGSWLGLFASVAPVEKPKYAVVVITRGQGERGKYAAAVAGRVYEALRPRLLQDGARDMAGLPDKYKTTATRNRTIIAVPVDNANTAGIDDEDEDDTDDDAAAAPVMPQVQPQRVPVYEKKVKTIVSEKPVNAPAKPLFKPVVITIKKKDN